MSLENFQTMIMQNVWRVKEVIVQVGNWLRENDVVVHERACALLLFR